MEKLQLRDYAALVSDAVGDYCFPTVTFDFYRHSERRHADMRGVEQCIGKSLRSDDLHAVRDGLSNVLYWGWAQRPGLRDSKVRDFRNGKNRVLPTDDRLVRFKGLVRCWCSRRVAAESAVRPDDAPPIAQRLQDLKSLGLPQFSQMSFTTKILMFLDPENCPVLDLRIAKAVAEVGDFARLQGLKFGRGGIRITKANAACYACWSLWCKRTAARVNEAPESPCRGLRAVDVERALFTRVATGMDQVRTLLAGPQCGDCGAQG